MNFFNDSIISAGDMSQATVTSTAIRIRQQPFVAIQAVYTGSPVGTFKLQASNDNSNWTDIADSYLSISAAGDALWNVDRAGYDYIRLVYTRSSGTGTLNARINLKGL